jgi:EAL domain-containing protein (putative c-di-GMP-specific phosphodiesterase class I)
VARQWRTWTDHGLHLGLAVNLSAHDLGRPELPGVVHGLLAAYAMPPQALLKQTSEDAAIVRSIVDLGHHLGRRRRRGGPRHLGVPVGESL